MQGLRGHIKLRRGKGKSQPLYRQIYQHLVRQIQSGQFHRGDRLPSISKMVKQWKVDYKTVNIALKQMEEKGLIRFETGRGKGPLIINKPQCKCSMMFIRWSNHGFPLEITEGVRKFAEEKGLEFTIADVSRSKEDFINMISHPVRGIDGIILVPPDSPEFRRACIKAQALGLKIVFADRNIEGLPISSVSIDHFGGAHQATRHLLGIHDQPVYCVGVTGLSTEQVRLEGWAAAMREHDYHEHEEYIYKTPEVDTCLENFLELDKDNSYKAALELLKKRRGKKTSIFSCTGCAAQGIYKAAEELGLKVGKDVYVAGFGDSPACWQLPVPLSSIPQKWEELGYEAANVMFMEVTGAMQHPMFRLIPAKLRIRESSLGLGNGHLKTNISTYQNNIKKKLQSESQQVLPKESA